MKESVVSILREYWQEIMKLGDPIVWKDIQLQVQESSNSNKGNVDIEYSRQPNCKKEELFSEEGVTIVE